MEIILLYILSCFECNLLYLSLIPYLLYIEVAPPRPPLPGHDIPPPRPPPPETDDEDEMFMHAPQSNQPIMVKEIPFEIFIIE